MGSLVPCPALLLPTKAALVAPVLEAEWDMAEQQRAWHSMVEHLGA